MHFLSVVLLFVQLLTTLLPGDWFCVVQGELIGQGRLTSPDNNVLKMKSFSESGSVLKLTFDTESGILWMSIGTGKATVLFHEIHETVRPVVGWHGNQPKRLLVSHAVKRQDEAVPMSISSLEAILQKTQAGPSERPPAQAASITRQQKQTRSPQQVFGSAVRKTPDQEKTGSQFQTVTGVQFDRGRCHGNASVSMPPLAGQQEQTTACLFIVVCTVLSVFFCVYNCMYVCISLCV